MNLTEKMREIADTLGVYDNKSAILEKDMQRITAEVEAEHARNAKNIEDTLNMRLEDAGRRRKDWHASLTQAQRYMDKMYRGMHERTYVAANGRDPHGGATVSVGNNLRQMRESGSRMRFFRNGDNDVMLEVGERSEAVMRSFQQHCNELSNDVETQHEAECQYARSVNSRDSATEEMRYTDAKNDAQMNYNQRKSLIHTELINAFSTDLKPQEIRTTFDHLHQSIPTHENYAPPAAFPEEICYGYAGYEVTDDLKDDAKNKALSASCGYMLEQVGKRTYLKFPYGYSLSDQRFSTMFEFNQKTRPQVIEHMRSLALRLMMSNPANKAYMTLIDPIEVGKTFSMFAPLGDENERVIDTRIWFEDDRIEERLASIIAHTADVNFRCLQGRFDNILQYNEAAGKTAEPLRFLLVMDFPRRFTPSALEKLESIVTNGPSTGVYALIAADVDAMNESMDPTVQRIRERMNVFPLINNAMFTSDKVNGRPMRFMPMICSEEDAALQTITKIGQAVKAAENIVIELDDIYGPNPKKYTDPSSIDYLERHFMAYDASNGVCLPIGLEGASKLVELKLGGVSDGGKAHTYHAMIGGSIGSGKSALLHNIITNTLIRYNPREVQVYLVDLKDGVEFRRYAPYMGLSNLRVVGVKAEKEFGLSVLQELANEQSLRAQKFKSAQVSRIEEYNEKMRRENRMDEIIPRLVAVFDEVQALFDSDEDPTTKRSVKLLETLVLMGGSAFGIQIILATQDWANVRAIPTSLYSNFHVRIGLKCNKDSASTLLGSDNGAADRLATFDAGQAVFNEYAGHKDYNHEFRGTLVRRKDGERILNRLVELHMQDPHYSKPARQRLLSSDVADNVLNMLTRFVNTGNIDMVNTMKYRLWLGEGLGMVNTYNPTLSARRGQNLLLVGSEENTAGNITGFAAMSLMLESARLEEQLTRPIITVFDFGGDSVDSFGEQKLLTDLMEAVPQAFRVFGRSDTIEGLQILQEELNAGIDGPQHFVIFFGLNRARRLTDGSTYESRPRDMLARLIHEGPEKGMNFIVWANSPAMFQQSYGDLLGDFEHRLVFDKTEDDMYLYFVQDKKPEAADERNALSYNLDGDNQLIKLYTKPEDGWTKGFVANIAKYFN